MTVRHEDTSTDQGSATDILKPSDYGRAGVRHGMWSRKLASATRRRKMRRHEACLLPSRLFPAVARPSPLVAPALEALALRWQFLLSVLLKPRPHRERLLRSVPPKPSFRHPHGVGPLLLLRTHATIPSLSEAPDSRTCIPHLKNWC